MGNILRTSLGILFGPKLVLHPKLHNINLHNITRSRISQNPRKRMFIVQILLLIVTSFSLISRTLSLMQTIIEVNPHPRIAPCVNMWSFTFLFLFFFFFLYHFYCWCMHMRHRPEGQVEWTTPMEVRGE